MPHALRVLAAPLLAVLVLGRAPAAAQDREVGRLQPAIDAAIDGGVAHLLRTQLRDGSWEHVTDQYRNGSTALCALALLKSGVPREHAALQRALGFLQRELPQRTYSAGVELLLLAALDDPAYAERARAIAELLVDWEHDGERGAWAYPHGRADLSNTQLAALGLWSAWKLGVKPDRNLWKRTLEATIERHQEAPREVEWLTRGRSGKQRVAGFHYLGLEEPPPASASMTTAGLCVLKLGELVLGKDVGGRLQRDVDEHARQALAWLEHDWAVDRNAGREDPRQYLHYYLYGLERVAALYELDRIGEHAWYREGAEFLVADQKGGGEWGDQAQTSFALLFLSRATHPSSGPRARAAENARATEQGSVRLRGVLDEDLVLTLAGLDPALVEDYVAGGGAGVRVARVEYLVDGAVVATVAGTPRACGAASATRRAGARRGRPSTSCACASRSCRPTPTPPARTRPRSTSPSRCAGRSSRARPRGSRAWRASTARTCSSARRSRASRRRRSAGTRAGPTSCATAASRRAGSPRPTTPRRGCGSRSSARCAPPACASPRRSPAAPSAAPSTASCASPSS